MLVVLSGCEAKLNEAQKDTRSLEEIRASGKLVVLTRNAPTTLYTDRDEKQSGPEHDLIESFAASLNVEVEYRIKASIKEIIAAVENAEGDLAAAGLTITENRRKKFLFGPPYQDVTQQVVCRRDNVQPDEIEDLVGLNLTVIADSSYVERLQALRELRPQLEWKETTSDDTKRYFPELIAPLNLNESESLGWMMSAERGDLQQAIADWLQGFEESGELATLQERYYGFVEVFDYVDTRKFIRRIKSRYPKYRKYFDEAAAKYELSPLLLAAQAYQESHWRANARSPTGVRGIMMLTLDTARAMGVKSRLDPKQSIFGGAKYLHRLLHNRFAEEVDEPDRTWLALAAYNVGRGHLHDAQSLAREQGLNPHLWSDVKQVLPLLSDKKYYRNLKYGYARGTEPVRYVQRIRDYRLILENELNNNQK